MTTRAVATTERGTFRSATGAREFVVHHPPSSAAPRWGDGALVVVLHGCTQDAADVARGTRMDEWSDRAGFTVLYPEQPASANPKKCWNWYLPAETGRDAGEAGLLAALVDSVARAEGIPTQRVALVGMSAGAAMAASLAIAYPERYGALAMHSGVPALAAHDVMSAVAVMQRGVADAEALGAATATARGPGARVVPVLLVHGAADPVVSPRNLEVIARQWALANAAAAGTPAPPFLPAAPRLAPQPAGGLSGTRALDARGRVSVEAWRVEGLAHAWSGGSPAGTYTAPSAPDATALVVDFLREVFAR